jgi:hypothetical protein
MAAAAECSHAEKKGRGRVPSSSKLSLPRLQCFVAWRDAEAPRSK